MKKFLLFLVVGSWVLACGGSKNCKESCGDSNECRSEYTCLDTASFGKVCVPDQCAQCFDQKSTCGWSETWDETDLSCHFEQCF